ncbi:MAG: hypothetical protein AAB403_14095, partial [Planctomycetota bacterium]
MVRSRNQHSAKTSAKQGPREPNSQPNKINSSTPYDFRGKNLTPYGGLLPVATMLEKLGFQSLVEETVTVKRVTRVMSMYQFVLGIVLGIYVGFSRLNQLRFIAQDPLLTGILKVSGLPPQSTLWRFLAALHLNVALQILSVQQQMRERVWAAANVALNGGHAGHGHRGALWAAHAVWQTDGRTQELQPQKQRQEQLSARPRGHPDVSGRDAGIHCRRVAQRAPAHGQRSGRPFASSLQG